MSYANTLDSFSNRVKGSAMQRTTDSVELDAEPSTEPRHEGMGGLAKGLAIIEAFAAHDVMSVADAARASGATRAAARRCLLTLNELGYVERYGREFRPLERLRRLGGTTTKRERLARLAQPLPVPWRGAFNETR